MGLGCGHPGRAEVRRHVRPVVNLALSAVAFALAAYTAVKWAEYTPIRTTLGCTRDVEKWSAVENADGTVNLTATFSNDCDNTNPFTVVVSPTGKGQAFLREDAAQTPIGHSQLIGSTLPPHKVTKTTILLSVRLPRYAVGQDTPVQIATELHFHSKAFMRLFGRLTVNTDEELDHMCGFEVSVANATGSLSVKKDNAGPMGCVHVSEKLIVPGIHDRPEHENFLMSEEHLQAVAEKKNLFLGFILVIFSCIAVPTGLAAFHRFRDEMRMTNPNPNPKFYLP